MAPVLACRVLPGIEVTMGYERDDSTRWGNWPNTSMVQAVKSMGARHSGHEPFISFLRSLFLNISVSWLALRRFMFIWLLFVALKLTLTLSFTKSVWMRRTKWSAPHPSCGKLSITITIYLMALEIWSNMSCGCQPSNVTFQAWKRNRGSWCLCTTYTSKLSYTWNYINGLVKEQMAFRV